MDEYILLKIFKFVNPIFLPECIIQNRLNLSHPKYSLFWKEKIAYDFKIESDMNIDWRDFWYWNRAYSKTFLCKFFCMKGEDRFVPYLGILLPNKKIDIECYYCDIGDSIKNAVMKKENVSIVKLLMEFNFNFDKCIETFIRNGNFAMVKLLLSNDKLHNTTNLSNMVITAMESGYPNIAKLFLENIHCDPSSPSNYVIYKAVRYGCIDIVKILLADHRVNPAIGSIFDCAIDNNRVSIVELLLADKRINPSNNRNSAIRQVSRNGNHRLVQLLLTDPRVDPSDCDNEAIINASKNGHFKIFKLLLNDKRVDPKAQKNRALEKAFERNHTKIIELLLNHESPSYPIDTTDKKILEAVISGNIDVVKSLRHTMSATHIKTCISHAIENNHIEIIKLFLPNISDIIDLLTDNHVEIAQMLLIDFEPTHKKFIKHAVEHGHIKILQLVLSDSRINLTDNYDEYIVLAAKNGHSKIIKLFLSIVQINSSDALSVAASNGHIKIVKLLLADSRIDPSVENNKAIRMAISNNHEEIIKLLLADRRINPSRNPQIK